MEAEGGLYKVTFDRPEETRWKCWVSTTVRADQGQPGCCGCDYEGRHSECRGRMATHEPERFEKAKKDIAEAKRREEWKEKQSKQ